MYDQRLENEIRKNIQSLNAEDLFYEYGIIINADKTVFDEVNQRRYSNIDDWIYDYLNDTGVEFEKFQSSFGYDDEY